jgi:hypothetical protein
MIDGWLSVASEIAEEGTMQSGMPASPIVPERHRGVIGVVPCCGRLQQTGVLPQPLPDQ